MEIPKVILTIFVFCIILLSSRNNCYHTESDGSWPWMPQRQREKTPNFTSTKLEENKKFKAKTTAAQANTELLFIWEGLKEDYLDPRIMFWQHNHDPSVDNDFVEGAWQYTYGGTIPLGKNSTAAGSVNVPVPSESGLYNVFYCFTDIDNVDANKLNCIYSVPIAVVKCKENKQTSSTIEHVLIILPENHSFDSIYGKYCKAPAFSNPTCNEGPECCEAIPETQDGIPPFPLTDLENTRYDPCHSNACEVSEMNGGKMDKFLFGGVGSHPHNYAACTGEVDSCEYYFDWARKGAIADRFFQSSPGASQQGNNFFSNAKFLYMDNQFNAQSKNLNGSRCKTDNFIDMNIPTIADLLNVCEVTWTFFAEGYDENPSSTQCYPLYYDSGDNPFSFFSSLTESPTAAQNFRDLVHFQDDVKNGTLPSVTYFKGLGIHSEHAGGSGSLNSGQRISQRIIDTIANSPLYQKNTVIMVIPDESGGYYDHVKPPEASTIDGFPYGPRTQFVAVGEQVKTNYVSHIQMEPASTVKFIEWNWLDGTGQLGARDTVCNNLGDIFDPLKTGIQVPIY